MKNKKFIWLLFVVQILCLSMIVSTSADASPVSDYNLSFSLETSVSKVNGSGSTVINAGDTFDVKVNVDVNNAGFIFIQPELNYDPDKLTYNGSTTDGNAFGEDIQVNIAKSEGVAVPGKLLIVIGFNNLFATDPVKYENTGLVVTLSFTAKENLEGTSTISFKVKGNIIDANGGYGETSNVVIDAPEKNTEIQHIDTATHVHTWIDADCITPKTCAVCAATEGEALGHKWVDATCTTPKTCSVCNATEGEALGHKEVEIPAVAATCEEKGSTAGTKCSDCGEVLVAPEVIEALGHKWDAATCLVARTCTECGKTEGAALEHTEVEIPAVAPTCTEKGLTAGKKCSVCDTITLPQTEVAALGHTEVEDAAVAPTCTEAGKTAGKHCSVCNEVLVAQETVAALGHTEVEDAAVAPTCTEAGKTAGKHCSVCNEVLVAQETVAALGHTEVEDAAIAPTCTETGKTAGKHCSVCNEVLVAQEEVAALGHTEVEIPAVAPTCTEAGSTAGVKCSVCGEVITAPEVVNALGHTNVEIPAVAATCTEAGKTAGTKCAVCGVITKAQETVEAKGHTYGEWKVTKEATKKEVGEEATTCSVCGNVETRTIPVIEGGCKSSIAGISASLCAIVAFGATLIRKKKED